VEKNEGNIGRLNDIEEHFFGQNKQKPLKNSCCTTKKTPQHLGILA
jgi:hypothetical protein